MFGRLRTINRKLMSILNRNQKIIGLFVILFSIITAAFEMIGVSVIIPLIDVLIDPQSLMKNEYIVRLITATGQQPTERNLIVMVIVTVIVTYIIKNFVFIFNAWLRVKYSYKIQREVSIRMMKEYINRGYMFFLDHNYSELRQGVDGDVRALYYVINDLFQIITQILMGLFIGAYLVYIDWKMALGVIVSGVVCILIILLVFRRKMSEAGRLHRSRSIEAEKTLEETLHGIKDVLITNKQKYFVNKYNKQIIWRDNASIKKTVGSEIPAYIIEMIAITGIMIILCVRFLSSENNVGFVAVLGGFAVGLFRILPALGKVTSSINEITGSLPGLNAVYENLKDSAPEKDTDVPEISDGESIEFNTNIDVDNVYFRYKEDIPDVLKGVNITIPKGSSVAFVGESGAGKSTLADIVLGLLKPTSGKIRIDGIDISDHMDAWLKHIGYVPQTIFLSDASILENVAYGIDRDKIDEDKAINALKRADLWRFISSLDDGINTFVGDRGVRLSGGQRQRIGIARALYNEPDILILDEATAALDNETEIAVMESIESLMGNITMLIIAHRLTTIKNCDHIYELKGGVATERRYEDLIK